MSAERNWLSRIRAAVFRSRASSLGPYWASREAASLALRPAVEDLSFSSTSWALIVPATRCSKFMLRADRRSVRDASLPHPSHRGADADLPQAAQADPGAPFSVPAGAERHAFVCSLP